MIKRLLFLMVAFKIYAIIKRIYWFNGLPWTFTRSSHCEVFPEINLNQKRFNLYTSWVLWENQCILTIRKHALLWNKHEYQHSVDIFVKNILNLWAVCFWFCFGCIDCSLYTKNCLINIYKSIHACYFVNNVAVYNAHALLV